MEILEYLLNLFYTGTIFLFLSMILAGIIARKVASPTPIITRSENEKYFLDRSIGTKKMFPIANYFTEEEIEKVSLSVIVPAYNEEKRLPVMMDEALLVLENKMKRTESRPGEPFSYEVIIVDDGSTDKTSQVALSYSDKYTTDKVRLLKLDRNRGKGGAVRLGVLSSRGKVILFADADGATDFSEVDKLEAVLKEGNKAGKSNVVVIGSRAHLEQEAIASRSFFRTILMHSFHFLVWFFTVRTVRDTQCGFKIFPRHVALHVFSLLHVERWAFDVELLHVCERLNIPVIEVCVKWTEIEGSKIVPVFSWLQMGRDVLFVSFMYIIRAWKVFPLRQRPT